MKDKLLIGFAIVVVVFALTLGVVAFNWGLKSVGDSISFDPDTVRQKRIEKKIDEIDNKLTELIGRHDNE